MTEPSGSPPVPEARGRGELRPEEEWGAVLFVDVADSSSVYQALGDKAARELVLDLLLRTRIAAEACGGREVDQVGDEIFLRFPDARSMILASLEIRSLRASSAALPHAIGLRGGMHVGPVRIDGEGRLFGSTVHVAHRITGRAKVGQMLASSACTNDLPDLARTRFHARIRPRGSGRAVDVQEVLPLWAPMTRPSRGRPVRAADPAHLILRVGSREFRVSDATPLCTLGRIDCDFVFSEPEVSGRHARISRGDSGFRCQDSSTNGTLVRFDDGRQVVLHRDSCELTRSGHLVLAPNSANPAVARFETEIDVQGW